MRKFYLILFAAAALVAAACEKNRAVDPTPVTPTESTTDPVMATLTDSQINGTSIGADMTVAGLVKNVKTGQGIAGVNVTDGYGWARTDANGVYQMKANDLARKIYITTPAAFKIGQSSDGHPNFFTKKNIERGKKYRVDFFLEPLDAAETEFTLFAIGDPQCRNTAEVARYTTETIKKIKQDAADAGAPGINAPTHELYTKTSHIASPLCIFPGKLGYFYSLIFIFNSFYPVFSFTSAFFLMI